MDIYVGNLAWATNDDSLRAAFEAYGEVTSARVVVDHASRRSKGFGFVEMPNEEEAKAAVEALNGSELDGRQIRANESQGMRREGEAGGRGGFRREGRPPRREGGYGERRGYGDRGPRREGGFGDRGPRREGGFGERRGYGDRSPRREGGFGGRGGNFSGPRSPRRPAQPRESQW